MFCSVSVMPFLSITFTQDDMTFLSVDLMRHFITAEASISQSPHRSLFWNKTTRVKQFAQQEECTLFKTRSRNLAAIRPEILKINKL